MMDGEGRPTPRFRPGTVRVRLLAALVPTVLLTATVITGASILVSYRSGYRQVLNQFDSVATLKEAEIASWLGNCRLDLGSEPVNDAAASLLMTPRRTAPQAAGFHRARETRAELFEQTIRQGQRFEEIFLMDRRGEVVLSTRSAVEGEFRGLQPYFREGLERPGPTCRRCLSPQPRRV